MQNLLNAASAVFAEKGYRDATIAEICERAGANVAAVNYHFGDKETLYRESWRHAFLTSIKAYPPDGGVGDDAPPEARLRGQVAALLRRIADRETMEFFITLQELANPTGLLKDLIRDELRPLRVRLGEVVREILGHRAPDREVRFCTLSIMSQCVNAIVAGLTERQGWEDEHGVMAINDIEEYIDHVVRFSLAGISVVGKGRRKLSSTGTGMVRGD